MICPIIYALILLKYSTNRLLKHLYDFEYHSPLTPIDSTAPRSHTDQTGKNFYHVTQFHPITVNHICFRYISCHIDNKKSI